VAPKYESRSEDTVSGADVGDVEGLVVEGGGIEERLKDCRREPEFLGFVEEFIARWYRSGWRMSRVVFGCCSVGGSALSKRKNDPSIRVPDTSPAKHRRSSPRVQGNYIVPNLEGGESHQYLHF
jgi:hypothetical protein